MTGDTRALDERYLWSPKLLYFFVSLQFYALHQFRGNFAQTQFGIDKSSLGYGLGILMLLTFISNVFIAGLCDKLRRPKLFLNFLILGSCVFFQMFWFINSSLFWVVMLCYLTVTTGILPLLDRIVLDKLKRSGVNPQTYGKQRLFGSLAFLVANFIIEKLVTVEKKVFDFKYLRHYQAATTAIALFLVHFLVSNSIGSGRNNALFSWGRLLKNKSFMFFTLIILLNGVTRAAMTIYLGIYLTDIVSLTGYDLDSYPKIFKALSVLNKNPLATTSLFAMVFEIVILFNSEIITKSLGLYYPLFLAQVFQLLRFFCYLLMNPESYHAFAFICSFELMKGLNFGLTHVCGVQIATKLSHDLKTTGQMIYSGVFTGLASTVAGAIFGTLFRADAMKSDFQTGVRSFKNFFLLNIAINTFCLVLFIARYGFVERKLHWPIWSRIDNRPIVSENKAE